MRNIQVILSDFLTSRPHILSILKYSFYLVLTVLYCVYLVLCLRHSISKNTALIVFTCLLILFASYKVVDYLCGDGGRELVVKFVNGATTIKVIRVCKWIVGLAAVLFLASVIITDAIKSPKNLISLAGIFVFIVICFLLSSNPQKVEWRVVLCGVVVQALMGLAVMRSQAVYDVITFISNQITGYLNHAQKGAVFVFGEKYYEHELFMGVVAVSIFFNATTYALYHVGLIQILVNMVGLLFSIVLPASKVECFAAVSNIFFGPDATIMMVKPMVDGLSSSQLHTLVSTGMASIDAGMIPIFQSIGIPANHLLFASFMSAPAAVVFSRIVKPERHKACQEMHFDKTEHSNVLEAFQRGSYDAITFSANILAVLLSYVSLLQGINATLTWFGEMVGLHDLTLQVVLSYVFLPLVFLMGVETQDCLEVSKLVGLKTIINEFVAYDQLGRLIGNRKTGLEPNISLRSETIASYALCGYSNIGTIGTMIGFIAVIAPRRKDDVTRMAVSCLVASSFACFSTACTAALFYNENEESMQG